MQIAKLDHVNVRTNQLDSMIGWYTNVLGMRAGDRPDFPFPGAWLYAGDAAAIHLVGVEGGAGAGSELDLKLEHFAFSASGRAELETRLRAMGLQYQRIDLPPIKLVQLHLRDPDGNHVHVDFPADE
jgi:catechol 2,3-dioxygenase-like lactoylglutathione lyase family enzyme